jgi:hypothetical protein
VIARCERRIGQELRQMPKNRGGAEKGVGRAGKNALDDDEGIPPKLSDLGISYDESAAYQDMAAVEENVVLDAIDQAGAEGREVTKKDIAWEEGAPDRDLWWPVLKALKAIEGLPPPQELFAAYHPPADYVLQRSVPPALPDPAFPRARGHDGG